MGWNGKIEKLKLKPRFWLYKLCKYLCSFSEMWRAGRGAGLGFGVGTQDKFKHPSGDDKEICYESCFQREV